MSDERATLRVAESDYQHRPDLTFQEYQNRAILTEKFSGMARDLVSDEGPRADRIVKLLSIMYVGNGLGEAGEIQNKIKKILRDDGGELTEERREQILEEVGGLLWYVAVLCFLLDAHMGDVAAINLTILWQRHLDGKISGDGDRR